MAVHYHRFGDGNVRLSGRWNTVLRAAREDGVRFKINSGHRTMREQWALYRQNMSNGHPRPGRPLTAIPSPFAPHIRVGRADHALDVDQFYGDGIDGLMHWLRNSQNRAHLTRPVHGELWHLEINAADLKRLWRKYR